MGGGIPRKDFPSKHDVIFRYSKSKNYTYHPEYKPYSPGTMQRGRTAVKGKYFEEGLRKEGTPITDWWTDVKYIHSPTDKERLGYPTQKSEQLLERIIKTSTNPTDIVLDPFCGCGTAIAAAHKLGRRWIGIDVSPTACKLMQKRMRMIGITHIEVIGMPRTVEQLKALQPFEFQNWVVEKLHGRINPRKVGDLGIDGWVELNVPLQVKQSEGVGRKVVDEFETAIKRYYGSTIKELRGVIVGFSFTKDAYEEVARVKNTENVEITLLTVEELLKMT